MEQNLWNKSNKDHLILESNCWHFSCKLSWRQARCKALHVPFIIWFSFSRWLTSYLLNELLCALRAACINLCLETLSTLLLLCLVKLVPLDCGNKGGGDVGSWGKGDFGDSGFLNESRGKGRSLTSSISASSLSSFSCVTDTKVKIKHWKGTSKLIQRQRNKYTIKCKLTEMVLNF